ncbi:Ribosomal protein L19/L19e [Corchorus capsularis]|uniref:Ribosomal protein L19/L19e n=1 Tax=Corchorus capsularis TaxID=210143 RepID=A0A1R3KCQ2_COCAP|nr:Ribosomal protein L19/L19e [Corchorus capsularis]
MLERWRRPKSKPRPNADFARAVAAIGMFGFRNCCMQHRGFLFQCSKALHLRVQETTSCSSTSSSASVRHSLVQLSSALKVVLELGRFGIGSVTAIIVIVAIAKRLASSVLKCGRDKFWLDPNEINEISMANSSTRKGTWGSRLPIKILWMRIMRSSRSLFHQYRESKKIDKHIYHDLCMKVKGIVFKSKRVLMESINNSTAEKAREKTPSDLFEAKPAKNKASRECLDGKSQQVRN